MTTDWIVFISVLAVVVANLGTVIALHFHLDKKIDENRKETNNILQSIAQEMKDFHGRLERQDAEFKSGLLLIEERMRK
jgi:hypothetical protein